MTRGGYIILHYFLGGQQIKLCLF